MINKEALEILNEASTMLKESELENLCGTILKEAGLFSKDTAKATIEQLTKKLKEVDKTNEALKFGNKAWKTVGKAGLATGVAGAGYGLYQKKKSEQDPAFNMYNPI